MPLCPGLQTCSMAGLSTSTKSPCTIYCRHENHDGESDFFDFKWVLKAKHINCHRLLDTQSVNHFARSFTCLTTKVGLLAVRILCDAMCDVWQVTCQLHNAMHRSQHIKVPANWHATICACALDRWCVHLSDPHVLSSTARTSNLQGHRPCSRACLYRAGTTRHSLGILAASAQLLSASLQPIN